ncbi:MAG TPA: lysylphosphatidylglycerol synthase domain-containing protein [Ramlibacter sp.]|nr:lysylphosphatidylglycerol synthase domain-containing protein [Ramlibacter sp.]
MNAGGRVPLTQRPWWPWAKRAAALLFFLAVAALLLRQARTIDWSEVLHAVRELPLHTLLAAGLLAASSHLLYSSYDLLGRHLTGHQLGTRTVMSVTFISYAFNLNLGSTVGGIAFRFRLYSRLGLAGATITRILGFSMLTNWAGYLVVAGIAFSFWPPALPPDWKVDSESLRAIGAVALLLAAGYVLFCVWAHERSWTIRGHRIEPPSTRMAFLQLAVSCTNWSLIGAVVWVLLQGKVDYPHVLAVLLSSALAGLIVRIPAGLGVLEAVFVGLLAYKVPQGQLLAALLAYRGIYYLLPLVLATVGYVITEAHARRLRVGGARQHHKRFV